MISSQLCSRIVTLAGTALLCSATAIAQAGGGGMGQQSPGMGQQQPTVPGGTQQPGGLGQPDSTTANSMDHSMMDKAFVTKALEGGMAEVELGQLALQKSQNDDVKKFAQKMVDDHTQMGDQMKTVAVKADAKVPNGPSKKDKALLAKLQALSGPDFDKAYVKQMLKDHKQDEKDFKEEAQMATLPDVKDAATKGYQIISMHLQMIQQIAQSNGVAAGGN
jgi:putative membrane protein